MVGNGLVDNDGEYWVLYTPDGTAYVFGRGQEPTSNTPLDSVWTVPVRGAGVAGVCALCGQGWRWNLDRIIDPNGNVTTLWWTAEINHYNDPGTGERLPYANGGHLAQIVYGKRAYAEGSTGPAAVWFGYADRATPVCQG